MDQNAPSHKPDQADSKEVAPFQLEDRQQISASVASSGSGKLPSGHADQAQQERGHPSLQNGQPETAENAEPGTRPSHEQSAVEGEDPLVDLPKPTPNQVSPGHISIC